MTPRAWSYGLLFAGILWAALIVAWWLIMAAGTVGVEAWRDSAVPASAFTAIRTPLVPEVAQRQSATPPEAAAGSRGAVEVAGSNPAFGASGVPQPQTPSPVAASSSRGRPHPATPVRESPVGSAAVQPALTKTGLPESTAGTASTYGPGFDGYLALPAGSGIHVRICGAGGCIDRVSNDKGPVPSLHRVADLSVADFEKVCGLPWTRGLCRVSVEVLP